MKNKTNKKQKPGLSFRPEQSSGENNSSENQPTAPAANHPLNPQPTVQPSTLNPVNTPDHQQSTINNQPTDQPPQRILPYVNFQQREANRALATDEVLELLRRWAPQAYDLAEVVGKWVWVTFPEAPAEELRGQLSQFGFHWNNKRKAWQHPCGQFATEGSTADPRTKYGSHFAADLKAA